MWRPSASSPPTRSGYSTTAATGRRRILALALGSNVGDRVANIEGALDFLEQKSDVKIVDTSFLYETLPMYVHDQPRFVNGACLISTSLGPQALINLLKDAEDHQGRLPTIRNGPRVVDLDVLFDGSNIYHINDLPERSLNVPHPQIQEREFVLRPLADMIPNFQHPVLRSTVINLLTHLPTPDPYMRRIINFPAPKGPSSTATNTTAEPTVWRLGEKTYVMATLNTTPDSFSDGGQNNTLSSAIQYALRSTSTDGGGADMIDVGGFSTRPGSSTVSEGEELARTVPYIAALRNSGLQIPVSVDTFRASVAERCLEAGANCVNDVYALTGPHVGVADTRVDDIVKEKFTGIEVSDADAMLNLAVRAKVPVILMHSRGSANANKDYSAYGEGGVMEGVRKELELRVGRALKAGVRRWNVVLDPGIGFSKTVEDNLRLVRGHAQLTQLKTKKEGSAAPVEYALPASPAINLAGFATLVGTSRKGYLGHILGRAGTLRDAREREWGTAAAVTAVVQQGVDIVRVHSVQAMRDVVTVADAIWRSR